MIALSRTLAASAGGGDADEIRELSEELEPAASAGGTPTMPFEPSQPSAVSRDDFRCPTCGARQALADTCRRCKCDLSLVVAVQRRRQALRRQCLQRLGRQQTAAAVQAAEELRALAPDADSTRLLAVAQFACGDFPRALQTLVRQPGS